MRRRLLVILIAMITAMAFVAVPATAQESDVSCDINGDGHADVAFGAPREGIGAASSGALHVFYGSGGTLQPTGDDLWHQDDPGVTGAPEQGDLLGSSIACADFDGDGFADVAAGAHGEALGVTRAGAVQVFYGSGDGIGDRNDLWHTDDAGVKGVAAEDDQFGRALAAGHLDDDQYADLVVGSPGVDVSGENGAGAVAVLYSSADGVTRTDQLLHQDGDGMKGGAETADSFGNAVGTADFDADGFDDLIVGVPGEDIGGHSDAGAVQVIYGSSTGLAGRDDLWHQDVSGIAAHAGAADHFGAAVGAGDFDADGFVDLAVGVVGEDLAGNDQAGAVQVLYGSDAGITRRDQLWHQNDDGVGGTAEGDDLFGFSVSGADFDADGSDDLAVGVAGEGIGGASRAGALQTLYGGTDLLTARGELWHQNDSDVGGTAERGDNVGASLP